MLKQYAHPSYFSDEAIGYSDYQKQKESLRATFHNFMLNLKKHNLAGGALLEVGCSYGYLLEEAIGFFETRTGTEFMHEAAEQARKKADHVYEGGIDQIPANEKFDCIVAIQVLEHVYQPKSFLEKLRCHLLPTGKIILATPDIGSPWRRIMGHQWPSFKIPEHILYFDKRSLSSLMRQSGFIHINAIPYPHAFPITLAASKFKITLPRILNTFKIWIPATTIAMYGVISDGESND
jgi:2-polyprenyl-3-methyl-5-hydroxy-6-metoxy-1,4-benzoquinol methylase